ncbi:hypothetical protein [Paenibacillus durus]|uniref:Uncharacterized protein n=1 Tax=Paenibacillus durus TaxID=44251 RepID=A0A089HPB1_PAEDU|nr:hypothetical protein [Paenibacillus durus]AIQ13841.1 hypothetical protein PDUR_19430 [Paenibacillus durus]
MDKVLTATSYGVSVFSLDVLHEFLKKEKVRTKKVLKNFQDNHDRYLQSLREGAWIPFVPINAIKYSIKLENNGEFFNDEWKKVFEHVDFNIQIKDYLWIAGLGVFLDFNKERFNEDVIKSETFDGEPLYYGFRYNFKNGKYFLKISGYARKQELEYPNANYGFSFSLVETNEFDGLNDPREDEIYNFNVADM